MSFLTRAPELHQKVVEAARAAFGGDEWNVRNHCDEPETTTVHILECPVRPTKELSTYSTVGLYLETNLMAGKDIRVELAGVAPSSAERFTNMLAHASFNLIKDARAFLHGNGYDAFEDLFAQHEVPYYDLDREPVV